MQGLVLRKLFLGFIQIHILHHAKKEPFFGAHIIQELEQRGYSLSAGTLYPILHSLCEGGLLEVENKIIEGRARKYYSITPQGETVFFEAKEKINEFAKGL